ncbi:MAG TPA: DUF4157 domain-containing protein [Thermoanaerobaculia bacterium]|nr:DUF4157 domain-containing protein [Thermoanaerobaculia bacterium]
MVRAPFARHPQKTAPSSSLYGQPARPFVVQPRAAEEADLEVWQRRAEAFGHRLKPGGAGKSLPHALRRKMEGAFGTDFSRVRVHEDHRASSIGAVAYAQGDHIHFAPGKFQPHTARGQQIVGHELAHVVQQRSGRVPLPPGGGLPINADESLEREADRLGTEAASGRKALAGGQLPGSQLPGKATAPGAATAAPVAQPMLRRLLGSGRTMTRGMGGGGGGGEDWQRRLAALKEMEKARRQSGKIDLNTYDPKKNRPSGKSLYRSDDFPFHSTQPKYNTKKAFINSKHQMMPVNPSGKTPPALHVHGKPQDKAESRYISTSSNLKKVSSYGKHLIEFNRKALKKQTVSQKRIQEDIRTSTDRRLDETARNVTEPGTPLWKPSRGQKTEGRRLGIDTSKQEFNYRERAALNSQRDREHLIEGPTSDFQFWRFVPSSLFGSKYAKLNMAKIGRQQGRDSRTLHPEGFRIPLDEYGVEYMRRQEEYRQRQEEVEREQREDEEYRRSLSNGGTTSTSPPQTLVQVQQQPQRRRGGAQPGREEQYNRQIARMRSKLKKKKDQNKGE